MRYQWRNVSTGDLQNVRVFQRNENFSSASVYASQPGDYEFELTVTDWSLSSEPERVSVTVIPANTPPIANNGFYQGQKLTLKVGETLTLDADRSYDVEGEPLSYQWSATRLAGGDAQPQNPAASRTAITFSQAGEYFVRLLVSDGELSDTESVKITVFADPNRAPVTVFPELVTANVGESVFISGAGSYDPDGDRIQLTLPTLRIGPANSQIYAHALKFDEYELASDIKGAFLLALAHTDKQAISIPAMVTFAVGNPKPIARISAPSQATSGDEITVSGMPSADSNGFDQLSYVFSGQSLGFNWSLISKPSGSTAVLDDPLISRPKVVADLPGNYVFELQIDDFFASSIPVQHTITVQEPVNETPVAVITGPTTVQPGVGIQLDGLLSSDADGDALTYLWSVVNSPTGSSAFIGETSLGTAFFSADIEGDYSIQLAVSDQYSTDTTIQIVSVGSGTEVENEPPVAVITGPTTVQPGVEVQLDGLLSSDADGDPLAYEWSVASSPANSSSEIVASGPGVVFFKGDAAGQYDIQLVVSDQYSSDTTSISVTVLGDESPPPTAVISDTAPAITGNQIILSGANSTDDDGEPLTYQWSLIGQPVGGGAVITPAGDEATIVVDTFGSYVFGLTVSDGQRTSAQVTVGIEFSDPAIDSSRPIAVITGDYSLIPGRRVTLNASDSSDPNGLLINYLWRITGPENYVIESELLANPEFNLLVPEYGSYVATLIVTNGSFDSEETSVNIQFIDNPNNVLPVAQAGDDLVVATNTYVRIPGYLSWDEDEDQPLSLIWTVSSKPTGSNAQVEDANSISPSIVVDLAGAYVLTLEVNDGFGTATDSFEINAVNIDSTEVSDPGIDGYSDVQGVDANVNGVRDDVERAILVRYGDNPNLLGGYLQLARSIDRQMNYYLTQESVVDIAVNSILAMECITSLDSNFIDGSRMVSSKYSNTFLRMEAMSLFELSIDGSVAVSNPSDTWDRSCEFVTN